ncbi:nucleotidyl transferase AbiEii/AbiGii toxin family protein [uncultured Mucilaginibacter sp.]|uniref:nucleotidyl transferase AbiEii/AbiGii toxin family protein n=1 Tax=uncultured Mucilaginibacter sp. TaxID=797541 RepID=UPI0025FC18E8|nr:nucleotidyl transferase AbiEii/AbiGii toxin family protein [uncultured Mucilaginibacter sp.]
MHDNLIRIKAVNQVLQGLEQEFVFVGGATVSLYATNPSIASEVRPTDDIDVIVEIATYHGFAALEEKLVSLGFRNDIASGVLCRYQIQGIIVDIMPTEPDAIGFSNKWYPEGFAQAIDHDLDQQTTIRIFSLPYFIASKWEAFKGRGKNDYRTSKDFEDMVYVWENVDDLVAQLQNAPEQLKAYLHDEFVKVIYKDDFEEGLYAHLTGGYGGIDANYIRVSLEAGLNISK